VREEILNLGGNESICKKKTMLKKIAPNFQNPTELERV
jgi:hypothetical protein